MTKISILFFCHFWFVRAKEVIWSFILQRGLFGFWLQKIFLCYLKLVLNTVAVSTKPLPLFTLNIAASERHSYWNNGSWCLSLLCLFWDCSHNEELKYLLSCKSSFLMRQCLKQSLLITDRRWCERRPGPEESRDWHRHGLRHSSGQVSVWDGAVWWQLLHHSGCRGGGQSHLQQHEAVHQIPHLLQRGRSRLVRNGIVLGCRAAFTFSLTSSTDVCVSSHCPSPASSWLPSWVSLRLWFQSSCCGLIWWPMACLPLPWASTPQTWTSWTNLPATPRSLSSLAGSSSDIWPLEVILALTWTNYCESVCDYIRVLAGFQFTIEDVHTASGLNYSVIVTLAYTVYGHFQYLESKEHALDQ